MSTVHHGIRPAVKALRATGTAAAFIGLCEAAHVAAEARGVPAGAAVIVMAFLACWIVHQLRELRHPAPARRRSRGRDRELAAGPAALAESQEPARLAA
jgi:hypothetical protein